MMWNHLGSIGLLVQLEQGGVSGWLISQKYAVHTRAQPSTMKKIELTWDLYVWWF